MTSGHGVARYARGIYHGLSEHDTNLNVVPLATWSNRKRDDLIRFRKSTDLRIISFGRRLMPLGWTYLGFPPIEKMAGLDIDLLHVAALGYPVCTRKPLVVTVHDMGPFLHPEYFRNMRIGAVRRGLAQVVQSARAVICVSRRTAEDFVAITGSCTANRVHVIYEGVDPFFFGTPSSTVHFLPGEYPFVLCVGKISPRKNVIGVLHAFAALSGKIPHKLVLVGGDGWDSSEVDTAIGKLGIADRVHKAGFVTEEQLRYLYWKAAAYVHPSLFEGFGLTILEAMAAQCPVITSNRSSLPEIAGNAALLVDPEKPLEIADAIKRLCTEKGLADELRRKGTARARSFSWETCAEQTMDVYNKIVLG